MAKYYVEQQTTFVVTYEVEADSTDEALAKYNNDEAVAIDNYDDEFVDVWLAED